ncbi:hypothetical protein M409DRAFT_70719 [Zasmidium cellare ATCC 36951]|uniref:NAD(P)-binding protein n=1 Tax=Zasmidium cellare ATCC 36951 TaxID=1080233 RepID=A0A6A6C1G8_ZASCE|nr:uncharacterized protein M409DRAFT_70719 [Zasmidium cellare ATCC 36951]KAF2160000.1 hypothetical protein M409DRAFT_70719 [Zasmidium cellare ATCC 36951]
MSSTFGIKNRYEEAHVSPNGPGDARPTAYQILKDNNVIGKFPDKTFLITGGSDGLGKETVRQLAKTGAKVWFTARNEEKAKKVLQELAEEGKKDAELKNAKIDFVLLDNSSLKSVKAGAEDFLKKSDQLNVLITNAGIANIPYSLTEDGFERTFATNHLAHFYLFSLLKPLLLKSSTPTFQSRVVTVASTAHNFSTVQVGNYDLKEPLKGVVDPLTALEKNDTDVGHYNPIVAYGQSKTANIWMANEITRRFGSQGLQGLSVHPGNILTAGWSGMDKRVEDLFGPLVQQEVFQKVFKSVEQGAATQVLAAISPEFEGKGGIYLDDAGVAKKIDDDAQSGVAGYKSWAYDVEGAKTLWVDSAKMVGVQE